MPERTSFQPDALSHREIASPHRGCKSCSSPCTRGEEWLRMAFPATARPVPPLLAHAPVCVHDGAEEVRAAVRQQFGFFARAPFYQNMFRAAGFEEVSQGTWSDAMIDAVVLWGDEARVTEGIAGLFALGAAEILVSPVAAGDDRATSLERTLRLLSQVACLPLPDGISATFSAKAC